MVIVVTNAADDTPQREIPMGGEFDYDQTFLVCWVGTTQAARIVGAKNRCLSSNYTESTKLPMSKWSRGSSWAKMNEVAPKNMPQKKKEKVGSEFRTVSHTVTWKWWDGQNSCSFYGINENAEGAGIAALCAANSANSANSPKQQNSEPWKLSSQESLPFTNFVHSFPPKPQTGPQALAFGRLTLSGGTLTTF